MKLAVQMYSIRSLAKEDLEKALRIVSEIGYDGVEFAGFFDHSAEEVKSWLDKYHLEPMGAHIPSVEIFDRIDETIDFHKKIGNNRIICPFYKIDSRQDVESLAKQLKAVLPKVRENGMQLYYHNHAQEFVRFDGECAIDTLYSLLPGQDLSPEFDVYWVYRGGEDPLSYLKKYRDRIDIFHAKDGDMEKGSLAGQGNVPLPAIFDYAKEIGMKWAVVESEASEDASEQVDNVAQDFTYLKSLL